MYTLPEKTSECYEVVIIGGAGGVEDWADAGEVVKGSNWRFWSVVEQEQDLYIHRISQRDLVGGNNCGFIIRIIFCKASDGREELIGFCLNQKRRCRPNLTMLSMRNPPRDKL
jgi:hypothetical protein